MHFASSKTPTLTPLGQRLIALSRAKLHSLDAPAGARDPTDGLRRGVLVREAIRSAWASLETPTAHSELTSWRAPSLDVLTEEDEEEEEYDDTAEERWLEDVLSAVDEDEYEADQPNADFTVGLPVYDEDEYDFEATESYTISYAQTAQALCASGTGVTVVAVCCDDEDDDMVDDWLEGGSAKHYYAHVEYAEELEVVAEFAEPMVVDSTPELISATSAVGSEPGTSASTLSPPSVELATPPDSPETERVPVPDLANALAALSTYALPPANTYPRLETKPLPEVEEFTSSPSPPLQRPRVFRRAAFAREETVDPLVDDEPESSCSCDSLGLACDADCPAPPLEDCEEDDECEECRTPPIQALDCVELEVDSVFSTHDWKAADRIGKEVNRRLEDEGFASLALGLRFGA